MGAFTAVRAGRAEVRLRFAGASGGLAAAALGSAGAGSSREGDPEDAATAVVSVS
ncbi:Hypothetical protein CAP_7821 [Chondromyces apiculatus DSM 436]|uniref:Uncharacterized protein n=1 Tax=Chondromyces apiculatus DSM 436 TaxID=1192034 RepID=A0A017SYQ3_9BACT|nr:Hypothetical protein CAP_7821 [Chondromyces apiculatus DSM 436]